MSTRFAYPNQLVSFTVQAFGGGGSPEPAVLSNATLVIGSDPPISATISGQSLLATVPAGQALLPTTFTWNWTQIVEGNTSSPGPVSYSVNIVAAPSIPVYTPPLVADSLGEAIYTIGDTGTLFECILQDTNGPFNLSNALSSTLTIAYPNGRQAFSAPALIVQSGSANIGYVSCSNISENIQLACKCSWEVILIFSDGFLTFVGSSPIVFSNSVVRFTTS